MNGAGLYYPFHLCPRDSLEHFLSRYATIHFRDFMALQLTPMTGTVAFPDRMSDYYPDLYAEGRLVAGHKVSGPISEETGRRVDRDLTDREWRDIFQSALQHETRFRGGLLNDPGRAEVLVWMADSWATRPFTLADIRQMSCLKQDAERQSALEYAVMLVKTSCALWYTIQLCQQYRLDAVTDSPAHDRLLKRILRRDRIDLRTYVWRPE